MATDRTVVGTVGAAVALATADEFRTGGVKFSTLLGGLGVAVALSALSGAAPGLAFGFALLLLLGSLYRHFGVLESFAKLFPGGRK